MILIALGLGCLGVLDLVRWTTEASWRRAGLALAAAVGLAVAVLGLGGSGLAATAGWSALLAVLAAGWLVTTARSAAHAWPVWLGLVAGPVVLLSLVGLSAQAPEVGGPLARWYDDLPLDNLDGVAPARFLLVCGAALFLTSSANVVVRLVLTATGSRVERSEQQLKGGRVLGPMERLLIFGLGLSGDLGAAAIIVAAKGLLRFPELQSYRDQSEPSDPDGSRPQRIDVLTEYFLIGSMTSWVLALALLTLL